MVVYVSSGMVHRLKCRVLEAGIAVGGRVVYVVSRVSCGGESGIYSFTVFVSGRDVVVAKPLFRSASGRLFLSRSSESVVYMGRVYERVRKPPTTVQGLINYVVRRLARRKRVGRRK